MIALTLLALMKTKPNLPALAPIFGSHMVLQREKPVNFWGWASPGETVSVYLDGKPYVGQADKDGKWTVQFEPHPAGGPHKISVEGETRNELEDIWFGDVWICSGQSNMEMGLSMCLNAQAEIAQANHPNLRLFLADRQVGNGPKPVLHGNWKPCTPQSVAEGGWGGFSGVAYAFGTKLQKELGVPIGLIQVAWGGTSAEAWTDAAALAKTGEFLPEINAVKQAKKDGKPDFGTYLELWFEQHEVGTKEKWYADSNFDGWTKNLPRHLEHDQVYWLKTQFELADGLDLAGVYLKLGMIRGVDTVFLNGKEVAKGAGAWERQYPLQPDQLKAGTNTLAIRLLEAYGEGEFEGLLEALALKFKDGEVALAPALHAKLGSKIQGPVLPRDREPNPTVPTVLYNGMIAPLSNLACKGAIWYQGETNMGRGVQYQRLLPALFSSWRSTLANPQLPIYVVSLANWTERQVEPGDSGMAELREAQALTALKDRFSGLAMAYDVGDALDIHPKDKKTVGERLALNALAKVYNRPMEFSGPVFAQSKVVGDTITLSFKHSEGLQAKGQTLEGFAIAGEDRKWHWAEAKVVKSTVVLRSKEVPKPVAVRYAWANNPLGNLYNKAGLPAVPFRTDNWPLTSANNH